MGIVEPVNPKPPIGRFGEIRVNQYVHIVDRERNVILCDRTVFFLPGFPVGQEYGLTPYHDRCISVLVEMTGR